MKRNNAKGWMVITQRYTENDAPNTLPQVAALAAALGSLQALPLPSLPPHLHALKLRRSLLLPRAVRLLRLPQLLRALPLAALCRLAGAGAGEAHNVMNASPHLSKHLPKACAVPAQTCCSVSPRPGRSRLSPPAAQNIPPSPSIPPLPPRSAYLQFPLRGLQLRRTPCVRGPQLLLLPLVLRQRRLQRALRAAAEGGEAV